MSLTLGPLFRYDLHRKPWADYGRLRGTAGYPRYDYRITAAFRDPDILNGGMHKAVDTGNASTEFPVYSPVNHPMRHLHHFDGARGREWDLGNGWRLEAWHLSPNPNDPPRLDTGTSRGPWLRVTRGQQVGLTGNTGADLPNGSPMPPHTHIALLKGGFPVDPEPHLYIDARPGVAIAGALDDMEHFTDVPEGHPFYHDIEWMADNNLTAGYPNGDGTYRYEPDKPTSRAEMAAFLHRLERLLEG